MSISTNSADGQASAGEEFPRTSWTVAGTAIFLAVTLAASMLFWWSLRASYEENHRNEIATGITAQTYTLLQLSQDAADGSQRAEQQWFALHDRLAERLGALDEGASPAVAVHVEAIRKLHAQSLTVFSQLVMEGVEGDWQRRRLEEQLTALSSEKASRAEALSGELRNSLYRTQERSAYLFAGSMILLLIGAGFNHFRMSRLTRAITRRHEQMKALAEERARQSQALQREMEKRQRAEQQNIESEKLASIGTLAAGVAHELNNPLMGVLNYVEYCRSRLPEDDRKHGILGDAVKEVRRCIDIVRDLLTFSRRGEEADEALQEIAVEGLLKRVLRLLSYRTKDVEVEWKLEAGLPRAAGRPNKLQQVFLNITANALDALEAREDGGAKQLSVAVVPREDRLDVLISDTGTGIPADRLARVFDPFYTTKEVGKGTGLGLSIARNLVADMGGELKLDSEPGRGTTATISLPLAQDSS